MGLGAAISGGIIMVALVYVFLVMPNIFEKTSVVQEASSAISKVENAIWNTEIWFSDIITTSQSQLVRFTLSNSGQEKFWNYDKFDFFVTYDAYIDGSKVKTTEKLSYRGTVGTINEPIDVDQVTTFTGNCDPCTFQHSVTNIGSNKFLIVAVAGNNDESVNSITFDGQSLTKIRDDNNDRFTELWYMTNPSIGQFDVIVDLSSSQNYVLTAMSFTGVNLSDPIGADDGNNGSSSTPSTSITTTVPNSMIVDVVSTRGGPMTPGSSQLERWENNQGNTRGSGSTKDAITTGAYTMSWTNGDGIRDWAISAVELKPANDPVLYSQQWTISNISPDNLDPNIINYYEQASVIGKLSYPIHPAGNVIVAGSTDLGVDTSTSFTVP